MSGAVCYRCGVNPISLRLAIWCEPCYPVVQREWVARPDDSAEPTERVAEILAGVIREGFALHEARKRRDTT